jgi:hypothetical protein
MFEQIKHDARDFGGLQFALLSPEEVAQRMCCATGCGNPGYLQQLLSVPDDPPEVYNAIGLRIICRVHLVRICLAIGTVLGDPSPTGEAMDVARRSGLEWVRFLRERPKAEPINPEEFHCIICGGRLMAETQGMFSGRRWIHTCEKVTT